MACYDVRYDKIKEWLLELKNPHGIIACKKLVYNKSIFIYYQRY